MELLDALTQQCPTKLYSSWFLQSDVNEPLGGYSVGHATIEHNI